MAKLTPFLIAGLLISTACTRSAGPQSQEADVATGIFSNRPQALDRAVILIKLKQEPLLTSLSEDKGARKVDAERLKLIEAEQAQLMKDLAALSSEIKPLYTYRMTLNAVAVAIPVALLEKIRGIANVAYVETAGSFSRPKIMTKETSAGRSDIRAHNSVKFIGGEDAHARGMRGQGTRVGIIDTGIDYTHAMFGGEGTAEAYKAINPDLPNAAFPNAKIVGGIDLAGTDYNSASANPAFRIPKPDANPLDEGGHGSHVAGTVAGRGDGVNTYDGVAPDALLYAIKVFGKDGSTGDATVIAALEYAADPNADADPTDRLDVVNLSLGGEFGDAHLLYNQAIANLTAGGTVVVASAGNSGDVGYIVGAPSVSEDALSVAASVDDMEQNWKFRAVRFNSADGEVVVEGIEASIAKPIAEAGDVTGPLVYAGIADQDFDEAMQAKLKGKIAFIDRGAVTFADKIRRAAAAGAIGVVVANNQPGEPLAMGGDGKYDIPAIMITQDLGNRLKSANSRGDVTLQFKTELKIEKPNLIDSITGFSSKGPRSLDALLKPEIAAPGAQVISAEMGGGANGVMMSGTSMAGPHMAGVMALMRQSHPSLDVHGLKSLVMGTAKTLVADGKTAYPLSRQGAGRVQILRALDAALVSVPAAVSLGEVTVEARKTVARTLDVRNISAAAQTLTVKLEGGEALRLVTDETLTLAAGEKKTLNLKFTVDASRIPAASSEVEGLVKFMDGPREVLRVPVLMVANKVAQLKAEKLAVRSTSAADAQGALAELTVRNAGVNEAEAYPFNLLGRDGRKEDAGRDVFRSRACDLQSAGYRIVRKNGKSMLQFAAKLYEPMTSWEQCEIAVLIDADGDQIADQELVGIRQDHLKGLTAATFASVLLDAGKTRELRKQFELDTMARKEDPKEDYSEAILALQPMLAFGHSTVAIIEVPVTELRVRATGELRVRLATSYQEASAVMPDDFLSKDPKRWDAISLADDAAGYVDLPEKIVVAAGSARTVSFTKGAGAESLLMLYPMNKPVVGGLTPDQQAQIVKPVYSAE